MKYLFLVNCNGDLVRGQRSSFATFVVLPACGYDVITMKNVTNDANYDMDGVCFFYKTVSFTNIQNMISNHINDKYVKKKLKIFLQKKFHLGKASLQPFKPSTPCPIVAAHLASIVYMIVL